MSFIEETVLCRCLCQISWLQKHGFISKFFCSIGLLVFILYHAVLFIVIFVLVRYYDASSLAKIALALWGLLWSHMNFRLFFFPISLKHAVGVFMSIIFNL